MKVIKTDSEALDSLLKYFYESYRVKIHKNINHQTMIKRVETLLEYIKNNPDVEVLSGSQTSISIYDTVLFDPSTIIVRRNSIFDVVLDNLCDSIRCNFRHKSYPILTSNFAAFSTYEIKYSLELFFNEGNKSYPDIFSKLSHIYGSEGILEVYNRFINYIYEDMILDIDELLEIKVNDLDEKRMYPSVNSSINKLCEYKFLYSWYHKTFIEPGLVKPNECTILYYSILDFDDLDLVIDDVVNRKVSFDYLFSRNGKDVIKSDFPEFTQEQLGRVVDMIVNRYSTFDYVNRNSENPNLLATIDHLISTYHGKLKIDDLRKLILEMPGEIFKWTFDRISIIDIWNEFKQDSALELLFRMSGLEDLELIDAVEDI